LFYLPDSLVLVDVMPRRERVFPPASNLSRDRSAPTRSEPPHTWAHVRRRRLRVRQRYRCLIFGLNPHPCSHVIPAMMLRDSLVPPRPISQPKPVTGHISMKTIIKPPMPFSPSYIMVLGSLFSPDLSFFGDTLLVDTQKSFGARGSLPPCRSPRLRSLTTE
jgi:hypothetical protein